MRPKKLVLVLCPDPTELGILMFSLSVNGYRVIGAHTIEQANEIGANHMLDAVLCRDEVKRDCSIPVVVKGKLDMAGVLHELKVACTRKRGPKKKKTVALTSANL